MIRTVTAQEVRERTDEVLDIVRSTGDTVVVEDEDRPAIVIISHEKYERLLADEDERDWEIIQRVKERNADKDPDEVLRDVNMIVEEVRRERHEREHGEGGR